MADSTSPQVAARLRNPNAWTVFHLSWPMMLKAIFLHGSVVIDGWLVSSLGELSLASLGLAAAIAGFPLGAILAFSHAMQVKTAQTFGTQNPLLRKSTLASGLVISVVVTVIFVAILALFGAMILSLLTDNAQMISLALGYLWVFFIYIFAESIGQCLSSYFNGCGRTKTPLYSLCLSVPVNVISSIIFIHGLFGMPALGLVGAAWGSVIGALVQLSFLLFMLVRLDRDIFSIKGWQHGRFVTTLRRHFLFALPIATTFISATFSSKVVLLIFAKLTLNEFAAMTLVMPWIMVAGTIGMQWSQATGIIVAQLLGQKTPSSILDSFLSKAWRGTFVAAAIVAAIYAILCLSSPYIYTNLTPETQAILIGFLPILVLLPFPKGSNAICGNTLRASGDTLYVMNLFLAAQWLFRVPATALAVLVFQLPAFWVLSLLFFEELIKFAPFHRRLYRGKWKHADVIN